MSFKFDIGDVVKRKDGGINAIKGTVKGIDTRTKLYTIELSNPFSVLDVPQPVLDRDYELVPDLSYTGLRAFSWSDIPVDFELPPNTKLGYGVSCDHVYKTYQGLNLAPEDWKDYCTKCGKEK